VTDYFILHWALNSDKIQVNLDPWSISGAGALSCLTEPVGVGVSGLNCSYEYALSDVASQNFTQAIACRISLISIYLCLGMSILFYLSELYYTSINKVFLIYLIWIRVNKVLLSK
jgi:hypothetical protein